MTESEIERRKRKAQESYRLVDGSDWKPSFFFGQDRMPELSYKDLRKRWDRDHEEKKRGYEVARDLLRDIQKGLVKDPAIIRRELKKVLER